MMFHGNRTYAIATKVALLAPAVGVLLLGVSVLGDPRSMDGRNAGAKSSSTQRPADVAPEPGGPLQRLRPVPRVVEETPGEVQSNHFPAANNTANSTAILSTGFEAPEWDLDFSVCGDEFRTMAQGGPCPDAGGFANVCIPKDHAASMNCCWTFPSAGDPNEETGWSMSNSSQHCREPSIRNVHPFAGAQHLRFQYDPAYGNPPGCSGSSSSCRQRAITSYEPVPVLSKTTWSYEIAISGTLGSSMLVVTGEDNAVGGIYLTSYTYFHYAGGFYVYDFTTATFVYGADWSANSPDYANYTIVFDPCNDTVTYRYGGVTFRTESYANTNNPRPPTTDTAFYTTDHQPVTTIDIDNHFVTHEPCVCGDGVKAVFVEECDGADDANCPGSCIAAGELDECTCPRICTLDDPCPLQNGTNGPYLNSSGYYTYLVSTLFVSIDTCGSDFDTSLFIYKASDLSSPLGSNGDCAPGQTGSDPSAGCYGPSEVDSCTCVANPGESLVVSVRDISTNDPPVGSTTLVEVNKKIQCGAPCDSGSPGDCNNNGVDDSCDIAFADSFDCNVNDVPDECESPVCPAELAAFDVNGGGRASSSADYSLVASSGQYGGIGPLTSQTGDYELLDGFWHALAAQPPPPVDIIWNSNVQQTRSIAFTAQAPATAAGGDGTSAIKLTMLDLQNPIPPNNNPVGPCCPPANFTPFDTAVNAVCAVGSESAGYRCTSPGDCTAPSTCLPAVGCAEVAGPNAQGSCTRWVGPPLGYLESNDNPGLGNYRMARLQCAPYYHDWAAEPGGGLINVLGAEIVPSSSYSVQAYGSSCKGAENGCTNISPAVTMSTRRAGDIATPFQGAPPLTQPNAIDVTNSVNKFRNLAGSPPKVVAQVQPNFPDPNSDINAIDIVTVVDNVRGFGYTYSGPCVCPSTVPCNTTVCAGASACTGLYGSGATCIKTCSSGPRTGQPCNNNLNCGACIGGPASGNGAAGIPCDANADCASNNCGVGVCPSGATPGFCRDRCGRCN